jgi:hypothetical protein
MKLLVWYQMGRLKSTKINKIFRREDNRFEKKFANREFGEKILQNLTANLSMSARSVKKGRE